MKPPTILKDGLKRFSMEKGMCEWCGQERRRTFDYRGSAALDYRLDRPTKRFCNLECANAYYS